MSPDDAHLDYETAIRRRWQLEDDPPEFTVRYAAELVREAGVNFLDARAVLVDVLRRARDAGDISDTQLGYALGIYDAEAER